MKGTIIKREDILRKNPQVDRKLVQQILVIENELRKIGLEVRPNYRLLPPLGYGPSHLVSNSTDPIE